MNSVDGVRQSRVFRSWQNAFWQATHVGLHLRDGSHLEENLCCTVAGTGFCRLLDAHCAGCRECRRRFCRRLRSAGINHPGPFAMRCFAGLTVTVVPVPIADGGLAFLFCDPVILRAGSRGDPARRLVDHVMSKTESIPPKEVQTQASTLPVLNRLDYNAAVTLMQPLARQLAHESRIMLEIPERGDHQAYVVRRSHEIIDRRFTENLHIGQVAREIGVSQSYLSHMFHRLQGLSFTDYIAGRRVIEAKRLLATTDMQITEILFASGFQSLSQANRVFRTATGTSPREFRAKNRQIGSLSHNGHHFR